MPRAFSNIPSDLRGIEIENIIEKMQQIDISNQNFGYDQFGFKICNSKDYGWQLDENDIKLEKEWLKFLEYSQSTNPTVPFSWHNITPYFQRTDQYFEKIESLVQAGIPDTIRDQIWIRLTPALINSTGCPKRILFKNLVGDTNYFYRIIEKDLIDVMPLNACFTAQSPGTQMLKNVLRALINRHYPTRIFYNRALPRLASYLVLVLGNEQLAYRMLCHVTETLLGTFYFCPFNCQLVENDTARCDQMIPPGIKADTDVMIHLIRLHAPDLHLFMTLKSLDIERIGRRWLSTMFAGHFGDVRALLRLWDLVFLRGIRVLFQIALSLLIRQYDTLKDMESIDEMRELISSCTTSIRSPTDVDSLLKEPVVSLISEPLLASLRQRYLEVRLVEMGYFEGSTTNNMAVKSLTLKDVGGNGSDDKALWNRLNNSLNLFTPTPKGGCHSNVTQSEKLLNLRESIILISAHFYACPCPCHTSREKEPTSNKRVGQNDSTIGGTNVRRKRAKALYDFEGHDSDELVFHRNDIVTVVSQKDQHCWLGEINGAKGWFPSKFVQLLDERIQEYCSAGDDAINEIITHLVRGPLCSSLKAIFMHGFLEHASIFNYPRHPWQFIQEAANSIIQGGNKHISSRLHLCRAFSLDEDTNILTPHELLVRYIKSINETHDKQKLSMDAKFRSLVCAGLNQQLLHLWFAYIIKDKVLLARWYTAKAFVRTPVTELIKVELRSLADYSFNLNVNWELSFASSQNAQASKLDEAFVDGLSVIPRAEPLISSLTKIQKSPSTNESDLKASSLEIAIKHSLFSWDL